MILKFEQMDWNEDWEEEEPINKGPFDDQLIYGTNGSHFKCGDRVKYVSQMLNFGSGIFPVLKVGTIVSSVYIGGIIGFYYLICLDEELQNQRKIDGEEMEYNIPRGHGVWSRMENLKSL